jgi:hypothetical protein
VGEGLEKLALERPEVPITKPENAPEVGKPSKLPPDGTMLIDRLCTIRHEAETGWVMADFADQPGQPSEQPRRLLPCELLEKMEALVAEKPDTVFQLTGESCVYRGEGFLLITRDPMVAAPASPQAGSDGAAEPPGDESSAKPAAEPAPAEEKAGAASRPAGDKDAEPTADDIFRELMRDKPGKPMDTSRFRPSEQVESPSVAPKPAGQDRAIRHRGPTVVDRVVTILPPGPAGWRMSRFISDNTLLEPPLLLLPCHMLEYAEKLGGKLRVSGLVTKYHGRRFLLLRKVLRERDMGQF